MAKSTSNLGMSPMYVKNFKGLVTRIESQSIPRGAASDSLNWHFLGDRVELRRGQQLMGTEVAGAGRVTSVRVARKYDGTQIPFFTYDRKIKYYDATTMDVIEAGSNALAAAASGEDISSTLYQSLAGSFLYLSSPNSGQYKIAVANPGSVVDHSENTYRGYIKAGQGRLFLWNRKDKFGGSDKTGLYLSTIDRDSLADYDVSREQIGSLAGDGATKTFAGTLAFKAANAKKTCHFVRVAGGIVAATATSAITAASSAQITSASHGLAVGDVVVIQGVVGMTEINHRIGVVLTVVDANNFTVDIDSTAFTAYSSAGSVSKAELFTDDRSGGLVSNLGGTGTINYATGAVSVTFITAPVNAREIVSDYYSEDATNQGICDFVQGSGSSIADSLTFRQDDAGFFQNLGYIGTTAYCLHTIKAYALRLVSSEDITNLPYRERAGIPYWRAQVPTGEGIYYMDATATKNPVVRILEISKFTSEVVPRSISDGLDLSSYGIDQCVMFEWGNYVCFTCKTSDSAANNRLFMFNRIWKTWEVHDLRISDMDAYNGALIGGDSGSNNLFKLFTGLADQDAVISNYLIMGNDLTTSEGSKTLNIMKVAGYIGDDQQLDVSYSLDNEPFVFVKSILGSGAYVDLSQRKVIGSTTLGEDQIGGGQEPADSIFASPYELEFFVGTARFERIRIKFEAKAVGYLSVSEYGFVDLRFKGNKVVPKYVEPA